MNGFNMSSLIACSNGVAFLNGALTFDTVSEFNKDARELIEKGKGITFDLSGIDFCDNSAVALLVSLASFARFLGKKVLFDKPPKQLLDLMEACRVKEILPLVIE